MGPVAVARGARASVAWDGSVGSFVARVASQALLPLRHVTTLPAGTTCTSQQKARVGWFRTDEAGARSAQLVKSTPLRVGVGASWALVARCRCFHPLGHATDAGGKSGTTRALLRFSSCLTRSQICQSGVPALENRLEWGQKKLLSRKVKKEASVVPRHDLCTTWLPSIR